MYKLIGIKKVRFRMLRFLILSKKIIRNYTQDILKSNKEKFFIIFNFSIKIRSVFLNKKIHNFESKSQKLNFNY